MGIAARIETEEGGGSFTQAPHTPGQPIHLEAVRG